MTKQELIYLISELDSQEDKNGEIEATIYDAGGNRCISDSIRVDMDSGRIIVALRGSTQYEQNKQNWQTELQLIKGSNNE